MTDVTDIRQVRFFDNVLRCKTYRKQCMRTELLISLSHIPNKLFHLFLISFQYWKGKCLVQKYSCVRGNDACLNIKSFQNGNELCSKSFKIWSHWTFQMGHEVNCLGVARYNWQPQATSSVFDNGNFWPIISFVLSQRSSISGSLLCPQWMQNWSLWIKEARERMGSCRCPCCLRAQEYQWNPCGWRRVNWAKWWDWF